MFDTTPSVFAGFCAFSLTLRVLLDTSSSLHNRSKALKQASALFGPQGLEWGGGGAAATCRTVAGSPATRVEPEGGVARPELAVRAAAQH